MERIINTNHKEFEKLPVQIFKQASEASLSVANIISDEIIKNNALGKHTVLGLATGATPTNVYDVLVDKHKNDGLDFSNVYCFNLDEYYPMQPTSLQSYVRYMDEYFFNHVNVPKEHIFIPDGTLDRSEIIEFCNSYENKIEELGGLDIQILGIGRTGHIGFNEPGSSLSSKTRLIALDSVTMLDAASSFFGVENVPKQAITMGVGTILNAKKLLLMAWGEGKADIIKETVEGSITHQVPATYLQKHENAQVIVDKAAAAKLTRIKTPWLVGPISWTDALIKKAVVWLSLELGKSILKLTDQDYSEHGMNDILIDFGLAYSINIKVFNEIQNTITGWPGGKPNTNDERRPERKAPFPKRVLIFSPHPDDDVISMGGTFIRLVDQGHEVHVAYQTSGNIAVFDDDALRFADFVSEFNSLFSIKSEETKRVYDQASNFLIQKEASEPDSDLVKEIKGLIRRSEAKAASRYIGLPDEQIHFLDLPFYETGKIRKKPLGEEDVRIVEDIIKEIQPHQIYAAGDLSDPHGTHRVCLNSILKAIDNIKDLKWMDDCWLWLYRGAWQEWDIGDIEMAVPLSPEEKDKKRSAIFKHQSQKDRPLFPGTDKREFWQRVEDRNKQTATLYDELGLAEYEAIEAFVRYKF
ncbi:MAG: glucosamine-6-phosphate deaminase [Balneolaceae bacterium]|nr:glucosamine-6-phosphate deaminase [Balneolaceae bacterium]MBO6547308.1 glucosamine-6-phosphate deaminase [Balneolaceae bacterium]MBO6647745.1 glucosamine-6-phosphate deaminase [Balneolaceae bacterium]